MQAFPINLDNSGAGAYCLCSRCGWELSDISSIFSSAHSPSLSVEDGPI